MNALEAPAPYDDLETQVERFFAERFATDNAIVTEAIRRMLAAGGKRLRPRITLLAVAACGGDPGDHLPLAAYMELIHVATLVHDDVVDNAQMRRGVNATAVDYGNRVSVLAGDYLFAWIFKNVTTHYPPPIPHVLSATLADICDGEVLQLQALGDLDLSVERYVEIAGKKTGSLFAASALCGAVMGGGTPSNIEALRAFGEAFGIAFQMNDDLLDVTADERSIGKPAANDLAEHKTTLPLIGALQTGGTAFRELVNAYYLEPRDERLAAVLAAIGRAGGVTATRAAIAGYAQKAKHALEPIDEGPAKRELTRLTNALLSN